MATLTEIDACRSLSFLGIRNERTADDELRRLAEAMHLPQLQIIAQPATPSMELTPGDSAALLAYLPQTPFFEDFQQNLQCLSETTDGEPLLTGWMSLERFREFLSYRQADAPLAPLAILGAMLDRWTGLHVHEVSFDGYRR